MKNIMSKKRTQTEYKQNLDMSCELKYVNTETIAAPAPIQDDEQDNVLYKPNNNSKCFWLKDSEKKISIDSVYNFKTKLPQLIARNNSNQKKYLDLVVINKLDNKPANVRVIFKKFSYGINGNSFSKYRALNHQNLVKFIEFYETVDLIFLVREPLTQDNRILNYIDEKFINYFESDVLNIIKQILEGLQFMNKRDLFHGSLNYENIFLQDSKTDQQFIVKISDYYLKDFKNNSFFSKNTVSNYAFFAPEKINNSLTTSKSDIWSVGVLAYTLLSGSNPFIVNGDDSKSFTNIFNAKFDILPTFDNDASSFIRGCLCVDMSKRLDSQLAIFHPLFNKTRRSLDLTHLLGSINQLYLDLNYELELEIPEDFSTIERHPKNQNLNGREVKIEIKPVDDSSCLEFDDELYRQTIEGQLEEAQNVRMSDLIFKKEFFSEESNIVDVDIPTSTSRPSTNLRHQQRMSKTSQQNKEERKNKFIQLTTEDIYDRELPNLCNSERETIIRLFNADMLLKWKQTSFEDFQKSRVASPPSSHDSMMWGSVFDIGDN